MNRGVPSLIHNIWSIAKGTIENMKNVFILANSFSSRTFLYQIDYLLNLNIREIYLLDENHDCSEIYNINTKVRLVPSQKMDEYIRISDIVLILQDEYIPQSTIDHIKLLITKKNALIIIDNPWLADTPINNTLEKNINYNTLPVVLQIVFGRYTQHYCTEILMNKILTEEGVPFIQKFSVETSTLIEQLARYGILNENILRTKHNDSYSVIVKTVYVNKYKTLSNDADFFKFMKMLAPSYILMNISSNFLINNNVKDIFIHKYAKPINVMIKSPYLETELTKSQCGTYCAELDVDDNDVFSPISKKLSTYLKDDILANLSMPEDVTII